MIHGLYTSTWGAIASQIRHEVIANNIANVNTTAFHPDWTVLRSYPNLEEARGELSRPDRRVLWSAGGGAMVAETRTSSLSGPVRATQRSTDLAIKDEGAFFVVRREDAVRYTRAGDFQVGPRGELLTADGGWQVLGENGPINVGDSDFAVDVNGRISREVIGQGSQDLGQIRLVRFEHPDRLLKVGGNLYEAPEDAGVQGAADCGVEQFALEMSGTNAAEAMVQMIEASRAYEANVQFMRSADQLLGEAASQIARLG